MRSSRTTIEAAVRTTAVTVDSGDPEAPRSAAAHQVVALARRFHPPSLWVIAPVALYLLLVLAGVTQSSIGIESLRADPAHPAGHMIGHGLSIRSDEFLTSTPLAMGVTATGNAETGNPLTAPQGFFTLFPSTAVSSVVLFDGTILRAGTFLPDQMLIAARWWLPWLLLALGTPAFFRSLVGSRAMGAFAAVLIAFSPMSAWWSFSPLGMLGFTIAGAAALQRCVQALKEGRRRQAIAWGALSAILLARTPLHYQPWGIVIAPAILLATIVALIVDRERRRTTVLAVGATGAASLALFGGVVLENLDSIRASLGTVYPGARVSGGSANPFQQIFGATALGRLQGAEVIASNHSEISSSFAIAAVWAVLLLAYGLRYRNRAHRAAVLTLTGVTGFWFIWSMVDFGTWGSRIPVLNLVPSGRSSDVLGFLSVILLSLVLSAAADRPRRGFPILAGGVVSLVAAHAGSLLRAENLPGLSVGLIWMSSLLVGVLVWTVTSRPRWWGGYIAASVLAFSLIWHVNPVLFGLGDLRSTPIADKMLAAGAQARADGTVWASDSIGVDALMTATGVPSLSSRQLAGPDRAGWAQLDPMSANEQVWNRGGSYISFGWTDANDVTMSNPSPDVIQVNGSPCAVAERMPQLRQIVSSHELTLGCLTPVDSFTWAGDPQWVYNVG